MKKLVVLLGLFFTVLIYGQEIKQVPQINVSGEGKIKITPDQVLILATVESKGTNAKEVKKQNDSQMESVLKLIKSIELPSSDYKTKRVSLNPQYDYEKKKSSYYATQSIEILLKDLSKYDALMEGLVEKGINRIDNVTFQSSKLQQYQSDARKQAMIEAKQKAEDYVMVLGQKLGIAITISDNSQTYYPQPIFGAMKSMTMDEAATVPPRETMAVGEIEITANVSVSFKLE
jgi:uncharacterized protein YggE